MNTPAPNLEHVESLLRLVDREIWLVTAAADGQRSGLTATWVSQVSIDRDRPVLLAGLSPRNFTTELVLKSGLFAAHLVTHEQVNLAYRLAASSGRAGDKLAGEPLVASELGVPVLESCRAWFVCRVVQKLNAGDRVFLWGDVVAAGENTAQPAAANNSGDLLKEHAFIETLSPDQRKHLKSLREADALALRPVADAWRSAAARTAG
jgi:flavin reductase (DIM6/NTAB) family NADH-FMN oxidoreductase RutF